MDPSKSAAYGMHAWEDGVDEALLLMGFTVRRHFSFSVPLELTTCVAVL